MLISYCVIVAVVWHLGSITCCILLATSSLAARIVLKSEVMQFVELIDRAVSYTFARWVLHAQIMQVIVRFLLSDLEL